jgi:hypothetical protein
MEAAISSRQYFMCMGGANDVLVNKLTNLILPVSGFAEVARRDFFGHFFRRSSYFLQ